MRKTCAASLLVALSGVSCALFASAAPPKLDKAKLEGYIRYAEGFLNSVKLVIDDPVPSADSGYFRVQAHLSAPDGSKLDRTYYVTPDGRHFVNGSVWDLNQSPFQDTLARLPTNGYSFGPANAKVTIVIFSDFECPFCRGFAKTVRENLPAKYPKEVRVIFKDFPIDSIHPWARAAAEASHCFGNQSPNAFWAFHDWIFAHQEEIPREITPEKLREKIMALGKEKALDQAKLGSCLDTHATAAAVNQSIQEGRNLLVQQTPTVFINGRMEPGALPWPALDAVLQLELGRPVTVPGPSAPAACCETGAMPSIPKE
jgi:protein-disulfide isomerase